MTDTTQHNTRAFDLSSGHVKHAADLLEHDKACNLESDLLNDDSDSPCRAEHHGKYLHMIYACGRQVEHELEHGADSLIHEPQLEGFIMSHIKGCELCRAHGIELPTPPVPSGFIHYDSKKEFNKDEHDEFQKWQYACRKVYDHESCHYSYMLDFGSFDSDDDESDESTGDFIASFSGSYDFTDFIEDCDEIRSSESDSYLKDIKTACERINRHLHNTDSELWGRFSLLDMRDLRNSINAADKRLALHHESGSVIFEDTRLTDEERDSGDILASAHVNMTRFYDKDSGRVVWSYWLKDDSGNTFESGGDFFNSFYKYEDMQAAIESDLMRYCADWARQ